jgi:hypothetical protein
MAATIGVGGLALRSSDFRALLWARQGDLPAMFWQLVGELAVLTGIVIVCGLVVLGVRGVVGWLFPRWVWQDPLSGAVLAPAGKADPAQRDTLGAAARLLGLGAVDYTVHSKDSPAPQAVSRGELLARLATCVVVSLAISTALLMVLMRSDERGQTIFAMLASFLLAVLIAHSIAPAPYPLVAWAPPLVVGVAFYVLGAMTQIRPVPQGWLDVPLYARVLPLDWATFGVGGGLLGYWFSARLHEARHIEQNENQD